MDKLLDFILCGGVVAIEFTAIIIGAILIQAIVYRTTGISLYNKLNKGLNKLDRYLSKF